MERIPHLSREEIIRVVEGKGNASRVPMNQTMFYHPFNVCEADREKFIEVLDHYPWDLYTTLIRMPALYDAPAEDPNYRWLNWDNPTGKLAKGVDWRIDAGQIAKADKVTANEDGTLNWNMGADQIVEQKFETQDYDTDKEKVGMDGDAKMPWERLDEVLANFPSPESPGIFPEFPPDDGKWYRCFFATSFLYETHWYLRGMVNALTDYYEYPDEVNRLYRAITDFYKGLIIRGKRDYNVDAIMISDDIGTQHSTFFSPDIFREFFKPYWTELIELAHSLNMHVWMHSCGNITAFIPDFIDMGLDVLHPLQKYTVEHEKIAKEFGGKLTFLVGMDLQYIMPHGTPEDVRTEVRHLMDTFYRPDGRFIITSGNAPDEILPYENMYAFYDECYKYGTEIAERNR